jgi:hypothetical protein
MFESVVKKYPKTPEFIRARRELKDIEAKTL